MHLKRIAAPRTWPILRKKHVFVTRPNPGKKHELSLPLNFILKEVIHHAQTSRHINVLLHDRQVMVDGLIQTNPRYPVGLYDVISIPAEKKAFRVGLSTKGKLTCISIDMKEADTKLAQIASKQLLKKGVMQLGLFGGRNVTVKKDEFKVGDSVILNKENQVNKKLPFQKGMLVQFIGGRHIGAFGVIDSIEDQKIVAQIEGTPTETLKKYAFVIGEKKPEIHIQ